MDAFLREALKVQVSVDEPAEVDTMLRKACILAIDDFSRDRAGTGGIVSGLK